MNTPNPPADFGQNKDALESIHLKREEFFSIESQVRLREHFNRYAAIRRFCYGDVLDCASGCGYGSFLLAANPEVKSITAVDRDKAAYDWAVQEYSHPKINYKHLKIEDIEGSFDTLVSLETIEHLEDPSILRLIAQKCNIKQVIISFPDKKSTHFNKWHLHDLVVQDVVDIFKKYLLYYSFHRGDVCFLLFMLLPDNAPSHIYRNISDLKL